MLGSGATIGSVIDLYCEVLVQTGRVGMAAETQRLVEVRLESFNRAFDAQLACDPKARDDHDTLLAPAVEQAFSDLCDALAEDDGFQPVVEEWRRRAVAR